ncbi:MAG: hypothetical protein IPH31_05625 [Lewinellaceae bacterium]|nr:hypothetical protein [Lewinellaceae bacterium]
MPFDWLDRLSGRKMKVTGQVGILVPPVALPESSTLIALRQTGLLSKLSSPNWTKNVAFFAKKIHTPGLWLRWLLRFMRRWEAGSVKEKIEVLEN